MSIAPSVGTIGWGVPTIPQRQPYRIAIVGCGPRGLHCLDALSRHLTNEDLARTEVTVFEPAECPGAGVIYSPDQPASLKMNFATEHIDVWNRSGGTASDADTDGKSLRGPSLLQWLAENAPQYAQADSYIPRALVGEYLHDAFVRIRRRLQAVAVFRHRQSKVADVRHDGERWEIKSQGRWWNFDEVVLATGHEGLRANVDLPPTDDHTPVRFVYPVQDSLCRSCIPAGSRVAVRGFGLTAIDAVLSLTEGRGGKFLDNGFLPSYIPSMLEPEQISLHSRSGRPMLAKPTRKVEPVDRTFYQPFQAALSALQKQRGEIRFNQHLWPILTDAAAGLMSASGQDCSACDIDHWYRGWSRYRMDAASAQHHMFQSVCVSYAKRPINEAYAIGETWRRLYPQLVQLVSFGGLEPGQYQTFHKVAMEMEKIAFGPPARSVAKMVRLIKSRHVRIAEETEPPVGVDSVIDAVIAGPSQANQSGPVRSLLQQGHLHQDEETGGIRIHRDGAAVNSPDGLAIFGRATEGWILGNDTLSRTLHDQIESWSQTIASRLHAHTH
ncbi:FAD/NAD(P)-binding protein [Crateriforma spongiae]|uniref:FAD/NAD(P)-binding protein n=1 Tax=Crateriforma spongiae TaxID=2724528 RepID=UPI0014484502|nr:FAD/NAD(P)-binding domain-containing protein [Crateriforma spongiae]